jgi:hypothetical protein
MSRRAATPAATLSAVMLKNIDNQTIDGEEKSKVATTPKKIHQGLDNVGFIGPENINGSNRQHPRFQNQIK